jgi:hypothetical protein
MTATEERLAALLREDLPPARDAGFRIAVLEAIERRRVRLQIALLVAVSVLASALLWTFTPLFSPWLASSGEPIAILAAAGVLAWASILMVRQGVSA